MCGQVGARTVEPPRTSDLCGTYSTPTGRLIQSTPLPVPRRPTAKTEEGDDALVRRGAVRRARRHVASHHDQ